MINRQTQRGNGMETVRFYEEVRRTERAVLLNHEIDTIHGLSEANIWWPLSQIGRVDDHHLEAPAWLVSSKMREIGAYDIVDNLETN